MFKIPDHGFTLIKVGAYYLLCTAVISLYCLYPDGVPSWADMRAYTVCMVLLFILD